MKETRKNNGKIDEQMLFGCCWNNTEHILEINTQENERARMRKKRTQNGNKRSVQNENERYKRVEKNAREKRRPTRKRQQHQQAAVIV